MKRPKKPVFNLAKPEEYIKRDKFIRSIRLSPMNEIDITEFKPDHKYFLDVCVDSYYEYNSWEATIDEYLPEHTKNPQYDYEMLSYNKFKDQYDAELAQYNIDISLWNNFKKQEGLKKAEAERLKKEKQERKLLEELKKKYEKVD